MSRLLALRTVIDPCYFRTSPLLGPPGFAAQVPPPYFPPPSLAPARPIVQCLLLLVGSRKGTGESSSSPGSDPISHALPLVSFLFLVVCLNPGPSSTFLLPPSCPDPYSSLLSHLVRCGLSIHQTLGSCKHGVCESNSSTAGSKASFVLVRTQQHEAQLLFIFEPLSPLRLTDSSWTCFASCGSATLKLFIRGPRTGIWHMSSTFVVDI